jgi:hypothetical protein
VIRGHAHPPEPRPFCFTESWGPLSPVVISKRATEMPNATKLETMLGGVGLGPDPPLTIRLRGVGKGSKHGPSLPGIGLEANGATGPHPGHLCGRRPDKTKLTFRQSFLRHFPPE